MTVAHAPVRPGPTTSLRAWRRRPPALRAIVGLRECHCCGLIQRLPELEPGAVARCTRCSDMLGRRRTNPPIATPLAFCLTAFVIYVMCVTQPIMTMNVYGRMRGISLFTGPLELIREGWVSAGILVGLVTSVIPLVEILLMMAILLGALHHRLPLRVPPMMRWYDRLRPWAMVEVYLLGLLVAYTKLIDLADIDVDPAAYALFALTLAMAATDSTLDDDVIWSRRRVRLVQRCPIHHDRAAQHQHLPAADHLVSCGACGLVCYSERSLDQEACVGCCPRCGKSLRRRKPESVQRTVLLVLSAVILYIPANVFPIMTIIKVHRGGGHTIIGGVQELYAAGMLPLALLVFFASITVPVLKILSLGVMCLGTWKRSTVRLADRTKLFRVVDFIGRWSMIDVFMVSILVAIVHYGPLANVRADGGMLAFACVVVLTIFAANCFDPRRMWDAAGLNGPELASGVGQKGRGRTAASPSGSLEGASGKAAA